MSWHYGIRGWRLVEVYTGLLPAEDPQPYAQLDWSDIPYVLRDIRLVVRDLWRYRGK